MSPRFIWETQKACDPKSIHTSLVQRIEGILELTKPFFTYNVAVMGLGHKQHPANQICSGHSLGAFTFPATRQDSDKMGILLSTIHNVCKVFPSKSFCLSENILANSFFFLIFFKKMFWVFNKKITFLIVNDTEH